MPPSKTLRLTDARAARIFSNFNNMNDGPSTAKTILLAEDDEDDYVLFTEAISDFPGLIQLSWVKNGEELIETLKRVRTDMVFLDINMPLKNGFECLTEIRGNETLKHLPVIIFSTSNDSKLVNWMYNAGANLYLCKPTEFKKLKSSIHRAIAMDWRTQTPYPNPEHFVLG
jgi:CheY-like chemotaxis protein